MGRLRGLHGRLHPAAILIDALFLAALFEILRRLFRNVGRGESSFAYAMYGHLAEHMQILVSGTPVQLPPAGRPPLFGFKSPFFSGEFLAGLLVLALSEVFRQGLALQRDSDLTV